MSMISDSIPDCYTFTSIPGAPDSHPGCLLS
jgi:hypothetical protein